MAEKGNTKGAGAQADADARATVDAQATEDSQAAAGSQTTVDSQAAVGEQAAAGSQAAAGEKPKRGIVDSVIGVHDAGTDPADDGSKVELTVEEDRTRLILQSAALLVLNIALLALAFVCWVAANVTGNVVLLIVIIALLTAVWFCSKRMGRLFSKFFGRVPVALFRESDLVIYEKADRKKALVVPYAKVRGYKVIRQGSSLRLLLWGDWVEHPSGVYYVGINRPFMKDTLDALTDRIAERMRAHRVKVRKK